jgi:hypothetical protein
MPVKEINGVKTLEDIHLVFTIGGGFILARGGARRQFLAFKGVPRRM